MNAKLETISLLRLLYPPEGYKTDSALFLTYSINTKTILSALIALFQSHFITEKTMEDLTIKERLRCLLDYPNPHLYSENKKFLEERVAFVCNNGNDESLPNAASLYTSAFVTHYSFKYSFHPKLYIIKYKNNDEIIFRFIIGSLNFVQSVAKEFLCHLDLRASLEIDGEYNKKIDVIEELLNIKYNTSYVFQKGQNYIQNKKSLFKVLNRMNINQYYFKEVPELITEFNDEFIKGVKHIFSPFLSQRMLNKVDKNVKIYTIESELHKLGYKRSENNSSNAARRFYIYAPTNEKDYKTTHFKIYLYDNNIRVGSLNFTNNGFNGNKEVMINYTYNDINLILNNLKEGYEFHDYIKLEPKQSNNKKSLNDLFRNLIKEICSNIYVTFVHKTVSLGWEGELEQSSIVQNIWENIKKSEECDGNKLSVFVTPRLYPLKKTCLAQEDKEKLLFKEQPKWEGLYQSKVIPQFTFLLEDADTNNELARVHLELKISKKSKNEARKIKDDGDVLTCNYLYRLTQISPKSNNDLDYPLHKYNISKIKKEHKFFLIYVPTLEELLAECINKNTNMSDIIMNVNLKETEKLIKILEKNETTESKENFRYIDISIIKRMVGQINQLKEDISQ